MNLALKKINARVKELAKKYPGEKRTTLQKHAGKEYRAGKLGRVAKKKVAGKKIGAKRKVKAKKAVVRTTVKISGPVDNMSASYLLSKARKKLTEKLGWYLATASTAKGVRAKRAVLKKAAAVRSQLRRIS